MECNTAPKAIAQLPSAINAQGRDHLRAALGLAVRHLEGREIEEEAVEQVGEELLCGAVSVLAAAVKSSGTYSFFSPHYLPGTARTLWCRRHTSVRNSLVERNETLPC